VHRYPAHFNPSWSGRFLPLFLLGPVSKAADPLAGPLSRGDVSADRSAVERGELGFAAGQRVRQIGIAVHAEAAAHEQADESPGHARRRRDAKSARTKRLRTAPASSPS
jgi:hypothetical protein